MFDTPRHETMENYDFYFPLNSPFYYPQLQQKGSS